MGRFDFIIIGIMVLIGAIAFVEDAKVASPISKYLQHLWKNRLYVIICILLVFFLSPILSPLYSGWAGKFAPFMAWIGKEKDFFTVWIALFGAVGIVYNISQNQKRITNQEEQLRQQEKQIRNQEKQLGQQEKQTRDGRFAAGVELLGNASESARIGGAYNLYYLAREYPEEYKKSVLDILCAHIRTKTTEDSYQSGYKEKPLPIILPVSYKKNVPNEKKPSNEIQTILNLLFRREGKKVFDGCWANLAGADLSGADLVKANLSGAELGLAYLRGADLSGADLSGADLRGANLNYANLNYANLSGAYLVDADLSGANLPDANLSGTKLWNANLSGARLVDANLSGAKLWNANLSGADLISANLSGADLRSANLSGAKLWNANLSGVDLGYANLSDAHLNYADLSGTHLNYADLSGAHLVKVDLSGADLRDVKGFHKAKAIKFKCKNIEKAKWE